METKYQPTPEDEAAWEAARVAGEIKSVVEPDMNSKGKESVVGTGRINTGDSAAGRTEITARQLWYLLDADAQALYLRQYPNFYRGLKVNAQKRAA